MRALARRRRSSSKRAASTRMPSRHCSNRRVKASSLPAGDGGRDESRISGALRAAMRRSSAALVTSGQPGPSLGSVCRSMFDSSAIIFPSAPCSQRPPQRLEEATRSEEDRKPSVFQRRAFRYSSGSAVQSDGWLVLDGAAQVSLEYVAARKQRKQLAPEPEEPPRPPCADHPI